MKKLILTLTLVIVLIFSVSCSQKKQKAIAGVQSAITQMGDIKNIKITADAADLRAGCSNTASVMQSLGKDSTHNVISQVSDWYAVKLPNNQIGFVSKDQCKPVVVENKNPTVPQTTVSPSPQITTGTQGATTPKTANTPANTTKLSAGEQQMVNLVNQARAQNNVAPLQIDIEVTSVARIKAQDMIDNKYFSHNSPKYGSPFDMMKSFGINYVAAGENIAGNQNVADAETALMNSPGHRANILNPDYTHIGIGIKSGGPYGNMFSQMFVSKPK